MFMEEKSSMKLTRKSVELLAPAGNWDALAAAVEAGADAVYLGGKHFNMRMHRADTNFDDAMLKKAVEYTHAHDVRIYITLNNLMSDKELPALRQYLAYLAEIGPDAILVQDFAVLSLVREMGIQIPLHASVMMNTHHALAVEKLREYGITRVVTNREMTLEALRLLREQTGIEVECFMHGDLCFSESGQCIHSGVIFGQSGNRGRCLKPCRWAYKLVDDASGEVLDAEGPGDYKLALKDMCMYRNIPELIQAGVRSFKIEGRMRPADFIRRIVATYRKAIDAYIDDPTGYHTDEQAWKELFENRARDFTTNFALGTTDARAIGFDGSREPRFFSDAVREAGFQDEILKSERPMEKKDGRNPRLAVRVRNLAAAQAAIENGADVIYVGGEAFRPDLPWSRKEIEAAAKAAHAASARIVVNTPRTTMARETGELEALFEALPALGVDGLMVSNLGTLKLAASLPDMPPLQADLSFNLFNHLAARFLSEQGLTMAAASLELSFAQLRELVALSALDIEVVVHGAYESMICDHNLPAMSLGGYDPLKNPELLDRRYALRDTAGEVHGLRIDQYGRNHILFARDLCLYPYLEKFVGAASYRIEAQDYTAELTGLLTKAYREAMDALAAGKNGFDTAAFGKMQQASPRALGIGACRFRESQDSI